MYKDTRSSAQEKPDFYCVKGPLGYLPALQTEAWPTLNKQSQKGRSEDIQFRII